MSNTTTTESKQPNSSSVLDVVQDVNYPGLDDSSSTLSSQTPTADAKILQPASQTVSCQECKLMANKTSELEKQYEDLKQSLVSHKLMMHQEVKSSESAIEKSKLVSEDQSPDIVSIFKNNKYTGNLGPLSSRFPQPPVVVNGEQPPEPKLKRLKGNFAKSVGTKIDGCDWFILHPDLDITKPEPRAKTGILQ